MKQYIKNSDIKNANQIIVISEGKQIINPSEEQLLADGWTIYVPIPYIAPIKLDPSDYEIEKAIMIRFRKREERSIIEELRTLSDEEALEVKALYKTWISYVNKEVQQGDRLYYNDKLYRVIQNHLVQEQFPPSLETASLYEEICRIHSGTLEDPIPYSGNMRLELGKFYIQEAKIYECIRDSEIPVYDSLSKLSEYQFVKRITI